MTSNFYSAIYKNLSKNLDRVFLKWPSGKETVQYTGHEILKAISIVCRLLENKKVKKGDKVLVALPFSFDLVYSLLGSMSYGVITVLPPASAKRSDMLKLILRQKIKAAFLKDPGLLLRLFFKILRIKILPPNSGIKTISHYEPQLVSGDQAALISHSSGSTGKPKAVVRTHQVLMAQHQALKKSFPPLPDQRDLPLFPNILLHNLSLGITTVIPDIPGLDVRQIQPELLVTQMQKEKVDSLTGNVFYFNQLLSYLQQHKITLSGIKELGIGGSPVPEYLPHQLKKHFINANIYIIYGSTQAEPIAVRKVEEQKDPALGYFVGKVHPDIELQIRNPEKLTAGTKSFPAGLIEVKGNHVIHQNGSEWLETGDYGYLNVQGELYLTGRAGNEGLVKGYSHYQLEHVLMHLHGILQAAAIIQEHAFKIYLQGTIKLREVRISLSKYFPESIISSIKIVEKMPLDNRHYSKVLYKDL